MDMDHREQGRGGGFALRAVLQDPGKHPAGGTRSWLHLSQPRSTQQMHRVLYQGRQLSPKQDRALVLQMCNKMWKQRGFGNRWYRHGGESF